MNSPEMEWLMASLQALCEGKTLLRPDEIVCPECWGKGRVHIGATTSLFDVCTLCRGAKTLVVNRA